MGKNLLRVLTILVLLGLPGATLVVTSSYALASVSLGISNAHDPDERVEYGVQETITPQMYFALSDNSYSCLKVQLEVDKTAVEKGYALVKTGDGTFPDLAEVKKTNYYAQDNPFYRVEYEFSNLEQGAQFSIPFPFSTAPATPHGTQIPVQTRVVTCDTRKVLGSASKTYTVTKELKVSKSAYLWLYPGQGDPQTTENVLWSAGEFSSHIINYEAAPGETSIASPCVYSLISSFHNWLPGAGEYGAVADPTLKMTIKIPEGLQLAPNLNPGWIYDEKTHSVSREVKPDSESYASPAFYLRFNCQGEKFGVERGFYASAQIKDSKDPNATYSDELATANTSVEIRELPKGMRVEKDNFIKMRAEQGYATNIYLEERDIKIVSRDKDDQVTTQNYSYNPTSPWKDNPFVYRLTFRSGESVGQFLRYVGDQYANFYNILAFRISPDTSPELIEKMKQAGMWKYYLTDLYGNVISSRPIPDTGEVILNEKNARGLFLGGTKKLSEADDQAYKAAISEGKKPPLPRAVELKKDENLIFEVSFELTEIGYDNVRRILYLSDSYSHPNVGALGYSTGQSGVLKTSSDTNKILLESSAVKVQTYTGNSQNFVGSVCQADKEYPGGCSRYGQYMMAIDINKQFLPLLQKDQDYKIYSVTLFPNGYEYAGDLPQLSSSGVADVPVKSSIVANYKGTGQIALLREYDLNALKNYPVSAGVNRVEAPISVRANDFAPPGDSKVYTYWYTNESLSVNFEPSINPEYRPVTSSSQSTSYRPDKRSIVSDTDDLDPKRKTIMQEQSVFAFSAPQTAFLSKLVSGDKDNDPTTKRYGPYSKTRRSGDEITYKLSVYSGVAPVKNYEAIDILPMHSNTDASVCDYDMVPVKGVFSKRKWQLLGAEGASGKVNECSAFSTPLKSDPTQIKANAAFLDLFTVTFSTEVFKNAPSMNSNFTTVDWQWKSASQITDWSKVTAFHFQLKPDKSMTKSTAYNFYTNNTINGANAFDNSLAVNQAAFTTVPDSPSRTIEHWTRTNNAMPNLRAFKITGNVFHDENANGEKESKDWNLAGYTIYLMTPKGEYLSTKTDQDGNYSFWVSDSGKYVVQVHRANNQQEGFSTSDKVSDGLQIYSAVDINGRKEVTLLDDDVRVDVGIYEHYTGSVINSDYRAVVEQIVDWEITHEVLKNNAGTEYVKTDDREKQVLVTETAKEAELSYRTNVTGTPRAAGDPRGSYAYIGFTGSTTLKNYTDQAIALDNQVLPRIEFDQPNKRDLFKCTFGIEPTLFKDSYAPDGSISSPTAAELTAQEEQKQKEYLRNVIVPASTKTAPGQSEPLKFYCILKNPNTDNNTAISQISSTKIRVIPTWANLVDRRSNYSYSTNSPNMSQVLWRDQRYNVYQKFTVDQFKKVNGGVVKEKQEDFVLNDAGWDYTITSCKNLNTNKQKLGKLNECLLEIPAGSLQPLRMELTTTIYNTGANGKQSKRLADWQFWPEWYEKSRTIESTVYLAPYLVDPLDPRVRVSYDVTPEKYDLRTLLKDNAIVNMTVNTKKVDLVVWKVGEIIDKNTKRRKNLPGAEFTLYRDKTAVETAEDLANPETALVDQSDPLLKAGKVKVTNGIVPFISDYDFHVPELYCGLKYYLVESKTPVGYNSLPGPVEISLSTDWDESIKLNKNSTSTCEITISGNEHSDLYLNLSSQLNPVNGEYDAEGNQLYQRISPTLRVYNSPIALLPLSGGNGGVTSLAFLGVASFLFAAYRIRKTNFRF